MASHTGNIGISFSPIPTSRTEEDLPALLARLFGGAGEGGRLGLRRLPGLGVRGVPPDEIFRQFLAAGGMEGARPSVASVFGPERPLAVGGGGLAGGAAVPAVGEPPISEEEFGAALEPAQEVAPGGIEEQPAPPPGGGPFEDVEQGSPEWEALSEPFEAMAAEKPPGSVAEFGFPVIPEYGDEGTGGTPDLTGGEPGESLTPGYGGGTGETAPLTPEEEDFLEMFLSGGGITPR